MPRRGLRAEPGLKTGGGFRAVRAFLFTAAMLLPGLAFAMGQLPFPTVFHGEDRFAYLVRMADAENWKTLPIGERTAAVGRSLAGTPYRSFTLEIDDHVESPSVNLEGMDCWTFFEDSLAFARMLGEPREEWTPQTMLRFIELDRYRGGTCEGYLSRLHYLEDWLYDNDRRGLIADVTRSLGAARGPHDAREMTVNWRGYRYMRNNPWLRPGIRAMEERVAEMPLYYIPKSRVPSIESSLRTGDIICIATHDGRFIGTSHVGLAYRTSDGVVHFLHASAPYNFGRVVLDSSIASYLYRYRSDAGIIVGRPLR